MLADERRLLVLNPVSGDGAHVDDVVELAGDHGFTVRTTESAGDATRFATEAAPEVDLLAAGGDGTLNVVVAGVAEAEALASTTVAVVPTGTGNNLAANVGVEGIEHAFEVVENDRRRRIDLGFANDRAFVNSCVGGVTAEASGATTPGEKREFGVLAYVIETVECVNSFEPLSLHVELGSDRGEESPNGEGGEPSHTWDGEASFVLIGNVRRFTGGRTGQANAEDGRFEVVIVEDTRAIDLLRDAAVARLLDREAAHVVRQRAPSLTVESRDGTPVAYSLDGEMLETDRLALEVEPAALELAVGARYQVDPDGDR